MKFKLFIALIIPILMVQCALYKSFFKKESKYYTEKEKVVLGKTLKIIGYDYGFDSKIELEHLYSSNYSEKNLSKKAKRVSKVLRQFDKGIVIGLYEKIYKLKIITLKKIKELKDDEEWDNYTYVKKYLLPPLEKYTGLLENEVGKLYKSYKLKIGERKKTIETDVNKEE